MKYKIPEYELNYEYNKVNPYKRFSEGMKKVIEWQNKNSKGSFDTNCSFDELRKGYIQERNFWNEGGPKASKIEETFVDGPVGKIPVRIYYPDDKPKNYACFYIHGGGFVVGNNDTHDRIMRYIMHTANVIVIGIDYHLSPEYKYPTQVFECVAVTEYFKENSKKWGIIPEKFAIAGDSGGGNLALATNLYLRDVIKNNSHIAALILYYPLVGVCDGLSFRLFGWEFDGMRYNDLMYYENLYFEKNDNRETPYYKIVNADLTYGFPPTYICCGELDPLLDGNKLIHEILKENNIQTKLEIVPGAVHAFIHYGKLMDEAITGLNNGADFYKTIIQ